MSEEDKALRNLIVNHLPADVTEEHLKEMFSEVGEVESAKLVLNRNTGASLKYGFVVFKDKAHVPKAIKEMNGKKVGSPALALRVAYAAAPGQPKGMEGKCENVYVAGFGTALTKERLREIFSEFGEVLDAKILDPKEKKFSKGVAFVKYTSAAEAESAIVNMNQQKIDGMTLTVRYGGRAGDSKQQAPQVKMQREAAFNINLWSGAQALHNQILAEITDYISHLDPTEHQTLLTVQNLPLETNETVLWALFGQYGAIAKIHMPSFPNGQCKGYCFVHYISEQHAAQAARSVNGFCLHNSPLSVWTRARMPVTVSELEANIQIQVGQGGLKM
eukprot:TRINITY_DN24867_c0_g1_i2.p1 TRINITY_DN24867_c0_g1~~TRINITY_DN24867_c0_g1_i2.p1  ORF type:complete len:352 (+),score=73.88 TRINITY_DN24867_c0_g1_i2:63-1058(+)